MEVDLAVTILVGPTNHSLRMGFGVSDLWFHSSSIGSSALENSIMQKCPLIVYLNETYLLYTIVKFMYQTDKI